MPETLTKLPAFNIVVRKNDAAPRAGESPRAEKGDSRTALAHVRAIEARCAAIDRIFAYEAASLVDSAIRRR
jgi:hypothetical protein